METNDDPNTQRVNNGAVIGLELLLEHLFVLQLLLPREESEDVVESAPEEDSDIDEVVDVMMEDSESDEEDSDEDEEDSEDESEESDSDDEGDSLQEADEVPKDEGEDFKKRKLLKKGKLCQKKKFLR